MPSGLRRGWVACRGDLTGFFHLVGEILGTQVCESPMLSFKIPWCSKRKHSKQCGKAPGISEDAESLGSGNEPRFLQLLVQDEQTSLSQESICQ